MKQFAVIGLGNFGFFLAKKLHELDKEVIAIDIDKDKIQAVKDFSSQAVIADATDKEVLEAIGLNDVDVVFVSMGGRMDRSILTTFYLKELGVEKVIVKAISAEHAVILDKVGADKVIFPERDMAYNLATSVTETKSLIGEVSLTIILSFCNCLIMSDMMLLEDIPTPYTLDNLSTIPPDSNTIFSLTIFDSL